MRLIYAQAKKKSMKKSKTILEQHQKSILNTHS